MAFKSYYKLVKYNNPNKVPFYVEDVSGQNSTLTVETFRGDATNVEYSTDGQTWSSINPNLSANGRVYIRATATYWENNYSTYGKINSNNSFKVGGNIMSLLYGSNFTGNETTFPTTLQQTFWSMFARDNKLTDASALILPATTLAGSCYTRMFQDCTSLIAAPTLPATTLTMYCYGSMFQNCTSLTAAPALPATTLAPNCYQDMFGSCTSLTTAPALPVTTLAQSCYYGMFQGCTNLTTAPELPATTLAQGCYQSMFALCTSLNSVTCLAEDIYAIDCTQSWLYGVSATGTFTKSPNMSSWTTGTSGIPSGWTVVNV